MFVVPGVPGFVMPYQSDLIVAVAPVVILVLVAILLVLFGFWLWTRSRSRERGRGRPERGGASSPPDRSGTMAPSAGAPPVPVEHNICDWELRYWTGTEWEVLRPALFPAVTCCVYKVRVETKIRRHERAARFHQDLQYERRHIPDYDYSWRSMDFDASASTRSGPKGGHDRMHGLGDPIEEPDLASDEAHWQSVLDQEPLEVASHLAHDETTRISITLEPGCPHPENTYTASGDSSLSVLVTQECTNDDRSPDCPVELSAVGWHWGEVWGQLDWIVHDLRGTDPDELARLVVARQKMDPEERSDTPAKIPAPRTLDSHDHDIRDPITHEGGDFDAGSDTTNGLTWTTWVRSEVELDADQLVPRAVWPTTDRVTTHIEQQMTHTIEVSGEMKKGDCDATGCCTGDPDHMCNCAPGFELTVDSATSTIEVDGKSFAIERDPSSADRRTPPVAGSPPVYRAWKLA